MNLHILYVRTVLLFNDGFFSDADYTTSKARFTHLRRENTRLKTALKGKSGDKAKKRLEDPNDIYYRMSFLDGFISCRKTSSSLPPADISQTTIYEADTFNQGK